MATADKVKAPDLIIELERLLELLKDPHPGLFTWHDRVQRRIASVGTLMDQVRATGVTGLVER